MMYIIDDYFRDNVMFKYNSNFEFITDKIFLLDNKKCIIADILDNDVIKYYYEEMPSTIHYLRKFINSTYYQCDQYGNFLSTVRNKWNLDNEWGQIIGKDIYIINHRCASSGLRKLCNYKLGLIKKDDVYKRNLRAGAWGKNYNNYKEIINLPNKHEYTWHMILHNNIYDMFLKKLPFVIEYEKIKRNLIPLLKYMECSNMNTSFNYLSDKHYISQISYLNIFNIPKEKLKLYKLSNLDILAQKEFCLDEFPIVHRSCDVNRQRVQFNELKQYHIDMIDKIYGCDNILYSNEFKDNYVI